MIKLQIINGPNLNLVGIREPLIYGHTTFEENLLIWKNKFPEIQLDFYQNNIEGNLIDKLHEVGFTYDGIILNAGGYTHTSIAIGDACASITAPITEVHLSNPYAREGFRHYSYISKYAKSIICGMGMYGYEIAIGSFIK